MQRELSPQFSRAHWRTIPGNIICGVCNLLYQGSPYILEFILELDAFGHCHTIFGDLWRTETLLDHHVTALCPTPSVFPWSDNILQHTPVLHCSNMCRRTLGPSVTWTASASFSTPARTAPRQSTPNLTSFAAKFRTLPYWLHAFVHEFITSASVSVALVQWHRRLSPTCSWNSYSARFVASPYHFLEDTLSSLPTASGVSTIAWFHVHYDSNPSRASFHADPLQSALVRARRYFESTTASTSVGFAPCAIFRPDFF